MKKKALLYQLVVLLSAMMCAHGASAQEAYVCFTPSDSTLAFYYDDLRNSRPGTTYDLNTSENDSPDWSNTDVKSGVAQVVFDPSFADVRPTTTRSWFFYMKKLRTITGISYLNTSEVTNMRYMFSDCVSLTSLDLSHFNTENVVNMERMFSSCSELVSLDLSGFNTSEVTNMGHLFRNCSSLRTIYVGDGWTTAGVTYFTDMFYNCSSLEGGQGTTWNPSNPTDKAYAHIDGGPSNPGYFTAEGTEPYACFMPSDSTLTFYYDNLRSSRPGTTFDLNPYYDIPDWYNVTVRTNVTKVVFDSLFTVARPTSTFSWFSGMKKLQSITGMNYLNTSEVTIMDYMFGNCNVLTSLDLSHFNTSNVTSMWGMLSFCYELTSLDLSSFNTFKVSAMESMFSNSNNLKTIYVGNGWSTAAVTHSSNMFNNCTSLLGGMGTTYDENHVDAAYAHIDGGPDNPGYFTFGDEPLSSFEAYACFTPSDSTLTFYFDNLRNSRLGTTYDLNDVDINPDWAVDYPNENVTHVVIDPSFAGARPTTTYSWFYYMSKIETITGLNYLNTSEVTDMGYMFAYCFNLTNLDLTHFNTAKVTKMNRMFLSDGGLTSLDLSSFNTSNVTDMSLMFNSCRNLRTIYAGDGWSTSAVTKSSNMFSICDSLVGGQGTAYSSSNPRDKTYAHIDGGTDNPGYFTGKPAFLLGDVNMDGELRINDVTALIDYLLSGDDTNINIDAADCNQDGYVRINDVTALIDYLLSGNWP